MHLNSKILIDSGKLLHAPEQLQAIASRLVQKGWAVKEKENHLALLYPTDWTWIGKDAECGYLWREEREWCWAITSERWWRLLGASNTAPEARDRLSIAIAEALDAITELRAK